MRDPKVSKPPWAQLARPFGIPLFRILLWVGLVIFTINVIFGGNLLLTVLASGVLLLSLLLKFFLGT